MRYGKRAIARFFLLKRSRSRKGPRFHPDVGRADLLLYGSEEQKGYC